MKVKMIKDAGVFKKGEIFDVSLKKAIELLTGGFCVRVKDKAVFSEENLCIDLKPKKQKHKKEVILDVL